MFLRTYANLHTNRFFWKAGTWRRHSQKKCEVDAKYKKFFRLCTEGKKLKSLLDN